MCLHDIFEPEDGSKAYYADLIERFIGDQVDEDQIAQYDDKQLTQELQEMWGEFQFKETGYANWQEIADAILEGVSV